jgi:hypothetical protein
VITNEEAFKNGEYKDDPAAYRDPVDLCKKCFKNPDPDELASGLSIKPEWVGEQFDANILEKEGLLNDDHPSYEGLGYECFLCSKKLTEKDD